MKVLFMCPHGAAKSVVAAALLRERAAYEGWDVTVATAGTEPDDDLNPVAIAALHARDLDFTDPPRLAAASDIEGADIVVSFGCPLSLLPAIPARFIDWSDAPDASVDADGLCRYITDRLGALVH